MASFFVIELNESNEREMNEDEFKALVIPGCRAVYAWACKIVSAEDASDIVQESLRRMWERRNELYAVDNIAGYAMMIAKNMVIDLLRERSRRENLDMCMAWVSDSNMSVEQSYEEKLLRKLFELLPANQRIVMKMSLMSEMSNSDIAEATGLSVESVRQNLSRGRKRLRELYKAATK